MRQSVAELLPGTMLEILRGPGMTEVAVVICSHPLMMRKATSYEAYTYMFKTRKIKAGEVVAAVEAVEAIEKAKAYVR